ncbi:MAG: 2-amino-4-hydroxy-6-hydroxymethyldihydropteridine diphosphokinase [Rikenellaceae bacterium]
MLNRVVLAIGANIGDKENNLRKVIIDIEEKIGKIDRISKIYQTEAWGFESSDIFYNQALTVDTSLSPEELLTTIWEIERSFGRNKSTVENEVDNYKKRLESKKVVYLSRTMDIDIIFYGSKVINTPLLNIPHLLVDKRMFVIEPLMDIIPNFIHPIIGKSIFQIYKELKSDFKHCL